MQMLFVEHSTICMIPEHTHVFELHCQILVTHSVISLTA